MAFRQFSALLLLFTITSPSQAMVSKTTLNRIVQTAITASPGFHTLRSPQLPSSVRKAARSIVRVLIFTAFQDLPTPEFKKLIGKIEQQSRKQGFSIDGRDPVSYAELVQVLVPYLQTCERKGLAVCRAPNPNVAPDRGSAVIIGAKGQDLYTAAHVIERAVRGQVKQAIATQKTIATLFIFSSERKIVSHPLTNPSVIQSVGGNQMQSMNAAEGIQSQYDYAKLHFARRLGEGVQISSGLKPTSLLYAMGFAACTGCPEGVGLNLNSIKSMTFSRTPSPNSSGKDLVFTVATVGEIKAAANGASIVETNSDGRGGMSGGPILDEAGRLVSIISQAGAYWDTRRNVILNVFTISVRPSKFGPLKVAPINIADSDRRP